MGSVYMTETVMDSIKKAMKNLERNNMAAYYCNTGEEARQKVLSLINPGDTVTHGGSETLKEIGVISAVKSGDYNYLDRSKEGLTREQVEEIYRKSYFADVYLTSSNAITENGELYNVDGNSNRVSAILYGPKSVIVVCGYNKIVKDLDEAVKRVKTIAAPQNTVRLNIDTYCAKNGRCVSLDKKELPLMCDGCRSQGRICCNYAVSAQQRHKDRIKVIIVGEELGY